MITLSKVPSSYSTDPATDMPMPNDLSECIEFGFTPDSGDGISTPGTPATVDIDMTATLTVPADGTSMVIWGHTFSVDNAAGVNTANTFLCTTDAATTANNFLQMLASNIYFINATVSYWTSGGAGQRRVNIDWKGCREQPNFTGASMDFSAFAGTGITGTSANGTTPVYVEGIYMEVRLLKYSNPNASFLPITRFETLRPKVGCNSIAESLIDYVRNIRRTLFTQLPDLSATAEILPTVDTLISRYKIEYGWIFRDENCQPQSGTYKTSGEILVCNAAFDVSEPYGMRWYWHNAPGGLPTETGGYQYFLTNQPKKMRICRNSYAWLWLLEGDYQSGASAPKRTLHFSVTKKDGTVVAAYDDYNICQWHQVLNFNVSPLRAGHVTGVQVADIDKYDVWVSYANASGIPGGVYSETLTYIIDDSCGTCTDAYFLTPPGGIGTLMVDVIEKEVNQTGTEICLDVPCGTSREERARYGGRSLGNVRAWKEITVRARVNYTEEAIAYFESFKASPERWIRVKSGTGYIAIRFNIDPGGIRIFRDGENVELIAKGNLIDIPLQSAKNLS